jgi:glycosyltransferase involved in cell wall biosynthesis
VRIGIDARELCGQPTGVGRYLAGLLEQWSQSDRAAAHEFVLYAPGPLTMPLDPRRFVTRRIPGPAGTWWEQYRLPAAIRGDHLDVFFAPGYTAPLRLPVPLAVAIHDVSFAAHPEWFTAREGWRRRFLSRRAAATAAAVITISEFSRGELVERLGADPARVHVIPPGITAPVIDRRDHAGTLEPRVLYVGSIFNRRRLPDLIRAFSTVVQRHPEAALDLVGDNRTWPRLDLEGAIAKDGVKGRVHWRQYVSEAELASLYGRARAFAFLSEYEGLGLTPLEALAAGVPPLLLDTPVARESCGAAALYASMGDIPGIATALERLLFDADTRHRLLSVAPAVLARYDWADAARRTLDVLETAASRAG